MPESDDDAPDQAGTNGRPVVVRFLGVEWTPKRRAFAELATGALTLAVWLAAEATGTKILALTVLTGLWVSYFGVRGTLWPRLWGKWGVLTTDWWRAARFHGLAAFLALIVVGLLGLSQRSLYIPPQAWAILVFYPPWAFCQQFLLQNAVVANAETVGVSHRWLPVVGMLVFGGAHLPDLALAGLTGLGGLLWTWTFLRARNLWLLSIGHTVVGSAAFLWVLGRDPLNEFPAFLAWLAALQPS